MVKIRLRRVGAKNRPMYRVVVADSRSPRNGAFIEVIGSYNSLAEPEIINIDDEKAIHWLEKGAKPTETVFRLLAKSGVIEKFREEHPNYKVNLPKQRTTQRIKKKSKSAAEVKS